MAAQTNDIALIDLDKEAEQSGFKFAKFLYLAPFLFGYVPGFSLNGSYMDIILSFVMIFFGTYAYSWLLSGIWMKSRRVI